MIEIAPLGVTRMLERVFKLTGLLLCLLLAVHPSDAQSTYSQKTSLSLDGPWTLVSQGQATTINVPATLPFFGGVSVWTKTFTLNLQQAPRVAYLDVGGIVNTATVKLNGQQIGTLTAFTATRVDALAALNIAGENVLELDIDDRLFSTTVPGGPTELLLPVYGALAYTLPIAWAPNSGIVRDLSLVYSDHAVITDLFVDQSFNSDLSVANLQMRLHITGESTAHLGGGIGISLSGVAEGECLAVPVADDELACNITISSPALWSPATPTLHDVWGILLDSSGRVDLATDSIGVRQIRTAANQILLNGNPIFLRGITRHDIYGTQGFVADEATIRKDLKQIQEAGVNFVRSIHYPPDPKFSRIADQMGMMISEEIPAWANYQDPTVVTIAQNMVTAMIDRDYNRASVIYWSVGNGNSLDANYLGTTGATAQFLDPSRPVGFSIDDPYSFVPDKIKANRNILRTAGINLYLLNAYWSSYAINMALPAMPTDLPVIITEWAGSEGSDQGPIGLPGTSAFPAWTFSTTGIFPESAQAFTILSELQPWLPFAGCSAAGKSPCISGLTFFNWQDIDWPGMPYFDPLHFPVLHSGLVYEDRTPKQWPMTIFQYGISLLPH
jgi:hypothetical protein